MLSVKCVAQSLFLELSILLQTHKNFLFHFPGISLEDANQYNLLVWGFYQDGSEDDECYEKKMANMNLWNIKNIWKIPP